MRMTTKPINSQKKNDWQYLAIVLVNLLQLIFIIAIIYFAVTYSYWLLLLLLFISTSDTERRILGIREQEND